MSNIENQQEQPVPPVPESENAPEAVVQSVTSTSEGSVEAAQPGDVAEQVAVQQEPGPSEG